MQIIRYAEIDSTMDEARRLIEAETQAPFWILADEQSDGRGRKGRRWISKKGNFHASYIVPCALPPAIISQFGLIVALGIFDLVAGMLPVEDVMKLCLKWPNDIVLEGAKFAGILLENYRDHIIIGCGVNLCVSPLQLDYKTTSLREYGVIINPDQLLEGLAKRLSYWSHIWQNGKGIADIRSAWMERGPQLGEELAVRADDQEVYGFFAGLSASGGLRLSLDDGSYRVFHTADVLIP